MTHLRHKTRKMSEADGQGRTATTNENRQDENTCGQTINSDRKYSFENEQLKVSERKLRQTVLWWMRFIYC